LAPASATATAAKAQAIVRWNAPPDNNSSRITGYMITSYLGSRAQTSVRVGPRSRSRAMRGLRDGASYRFKVVAVSIRGLGPARFTATIEPT
jgi:hypothetical protein